MEREPHPRARRNPSVRIKRRRVGSTRLRAWARRRPRRKAAERSPLVQVVSRPRGRRLGAPRTRRGPGSAASAAPEGRRRPHPPQRDALFRVGAARLHERRRPRCADGRLGGERCRGVDAAFTESGHGFLLVFVSSRYRVCGNAAAVAIGSTDQRVEAVAPFASPAKAYRKIRTSERIAVRPGPHLHVAVTPSTPSSVPWRMGRRPTPNRAASRWPRRRFAATMGA
jgi:hypothetical protein